MNAAQHSRFLFRRAHAKELPAVLSLISQRIRWMDACGIRQWNTTGYEAAYPPSYYAALAKAGTLFVLLQKENGAVCCAAVLTEEDPAWQDLTPRALSSQFCRRGFGTGGRCMLSAPCAGICPRLRKTLPSP